MAVERLPDVMLQHRIQQRAYEIHQTKANGSSLEDWLEAERQVLREIRHARDGFRNQTTQEHEHPR
jgi:hypothetical protein